MDKTSAKNLQKERVKLFRDQACFKKTFRIPHFSNAVTWKVFDAGHTLDEAMPNQKVMESCVRYFLDKYYVDGLIDTGIRNQFTVTDTFVEGSYYYYTKDAVAIKDHAHCTVDTLQEYMDDPIKYAWEKILPKKFGENWDNIPLSTWKKTFDAYMDFTIFVIHMASVTGNEYGIPSTAPNNPVKGAIDFGSEILESNLLGIKNYSIALRRNPDEIESFVRRWDKEHIDPVIKDVLDGKGPNEKYLFDSSLIMLSHNIMSPKQFERFYWPSLKALIDAYESKKMNARIFTEGTILGFKDYFKDYKKGTLTFHIENDDVFKFREELPNIAIMGGLNTHILSEVSSKECVDYTKNLIDTLGTGLILSEGKMLSYRNDANSENYLALCNFVKDYRL